MLFVSLFFRSSSTYCRCVGSFVWIVPISSQTNKNKEILRWWWQSIQFIWFLLLWSTLHCWARCRESKLYEIGCWGIPTCRLISWYFYIIPSHYADDDSVEVTGAVKITKIQFKKIDNPNWPVDPKKTVSTYNRVCHYHYCFLL